MLAESVMPEVRSGIRRAGPWFQRWSSHAAVLLSAMCVSGLQAAHWVQAAPARIVLSSQVSAHGQTEPQELRPLAVAAAPVPTGQNPTVLPVVLQAASARQLRALPSKAQRSPMVAVISEAFAPQGDQAVAWALRVAWCESSYRAQAVNESSGATGLFQFMSSTWSGTPWASTLRTDPVANAYAAAWLFQRYGPGRWSCK